MRTAKKTQSRTPSYPHGAWRKGSLAVVVAVLALCWTGVVWAQTGQITGTVLDEKTSEPLIGASVLIQGTTMGASCDLDGHYTIRDVPVGVHILEVSSVGYQKKVITGVTVVPGKPTAIDLSLSSGDIQMDAIEVTAERVKTSESSLLIKRRAAPQVLDGISAEMIKKSGDSDAGDAVKRVVGVTVVDDKRLVVRGMGGRYANVRLNGATLPSAEPEKKEVALDLFPSAFLDEVAASKTFTPDQPANFSGGSVNLITREFPASLTYSFSTSASYSSVSTGKDRYDYLGGDLDWLGVDDGTRDRPEILSDPSWYVGGSPQTSDTALNHQAGVDFARQWTPTLSRTPVNSSYSLNLGNSYNLGGTSRFGLAGSLTYSNSYKVRNNEAYREWKGPSEQAFRDYSDIDRGSQSVLWGGLLNGTLIASDNNKLAFKGMYNQTADDEAFIANGWDDYNGGNFMETQLQFVSRRVKSGQLSGEHHFPGFHRSTLEWRTSLSSATREEPDTRGVVYSVVDDGNGGTILKYSQVGGSSLSHIYTDLLDENAHLGVDWTLPLTDGSTKLKFGGVFENTTREFSANRYLYLKYRNPVDTGLAESFLRPETIGSTDRADRNKWYLTDDTYRQDRYDANDHMTAGYAMLDLPLSERLRVITGVRHEDDDLLLNSGRNNEDSIPLHTADWLPMGSVIYAVTDQMNLRGVLSRTMGRPEYRELAPYGVQDYGLGAVTRGNPDLRPTYIVNYDLRWEYFPRPGEILAVSLFAKDFTDPIEFLQIDGPTTNIFQYGNISEANNYGFELEARKVLDFLGHHFERFSAGGNLTVTKSSVRIQDTTSNKLFDYDRPLVGQSPYVVNAFLGYTSEGGATEVTFLYNAFGDRPVRIAGVFEKPIYEEARHQVDLSVSHKFWQTLGMRVGVKNLLGEDYVVTQEQPGFKKGVTEYYEIGRTVSFGISYGI